MAIGFEVIPDSVVIIRQKTIYKQVRAYMRGNSIYVNACGGFIRLKVGGGTSHPDIKWEEAEGFAGCIPDVKGFGWVEVKDGAG